MEKSSIRIQIPEKVNMVINRLMEAGFEAYVVGGCVRDAILGREANDWDITTNANPSEVKALFARTVDTGIEHGTVTVMLGKEGFEVTTYRIDGEYLDGRHPKEVIFTPSLLEDLKRRDFTINAMAYNDQEGLVDAFDGLGDLKRRQIRCVGDPRERFTEDALRILRAVRFSAQLDFGIEEETLGAISDFAPSLKKISAERIQTELVKLLVSGHPEVWNTVCETGIASVILPELTTERETLEALRQVEADKVLRLSLLLYEAGEEGAGMILRRLKFDNDTRRRVRHLIGAFDYAPISLDPRGVRRAVYEIGEDFFADYIKLHRAVLLAQGKDEASREGMVLEQLESLYQQILEAGDCLSLKTLAVTGKDLVEAGVEPGPALGEILQRLLDLVIEHPEYNTKEYLMRQV